jgi:hypothetical protein
VARTHVAHPLSATPSEDPLVLNVTASVLGVPKAPTVRFVPPPSRRTTVVCAFSKPSLQLARTQVQTLRTVHGLREEPVVTYHANELDQGTPTLRLLKGLPQVRVESLEGWYSKTYPHLVRSVSCRGLVVETERQHC